VKCAFGAWFYLAPAALYASLVVRFVPGFDDAGARAWGGLLNVAALLVFAATMARSIQLGFRIFPQPKRPPPGYVHEHRGEIPQGPGLPPRAPMNEGPQNELLRTFPNRHHPS
jgi:hypothetical protein